MYLLIQCKYYSSNVTAFPVRPTTAIESLALLKEYKMVFKVQYSFALVNIMVTSQRIRSCQLRQRSLSFQDDRAPDKYFTPYTVTQKTDS
jgi:hypothetical protein